MIKLYILNHILLKKVKNKVVIIAALLAPVIAVMSLIIYIEVNEGAKKYISNTFGSKSQSLLYVTSKGNEHNNSHEGMMSLNDIREMQKRISEVEGTASIFNASCDIENNSKRSEIYLNAVEPDYLLVNPIKLIKGRLINQNDIESKRNIIILDDSAAYKIFNTTDIIGHTVKLEHNGHELKAAVIGVYSNRSSYLKNIISEDVKASAFIPITAVESVGIVNNISKAVLLVDNKTDIKNTTNKVKHILIKLGLAENEFDVEILKEPIYIYDFMKKYKLAPFIIFTLIIICSFSYITLFGLTIFIGKRSISSKKVFGATNSNIFYEILIDIVIICLVQTLFAALLGTLISFVIGWFIAIPSYLPLSKLCLVFGLVAAINILLGIVPARYAASFKEDDLFID